MDGQVGICVITMRKSVMCGRPSACGSELAAGLFSCLTQV